MYEIKYTNEAKKQIEKLDKITKKRLKHLIELLAQNPNSGKKLLGILTGRWSYRMDNYRIIYRIYHERLVILV